jgi:TolB protein
MTRNLVIVVVLALAAATFASVVSATAPGNNGQIAFRRYFDAAHTSGAVFRINADGSGERRTTHPPKGVVDDQPDWSPDGSLITFSRCPKRPESACAIYIVRPDGSRLTRVSACPPGGKPPKCSDDNLPAFSPDGQQIVFGRGLGDHFDIVIVDRRTGDQRVVVRATNRFNLGDPQFSPDGRRLLFVKIGLPSGRAHAIFVANVDGSGVRQVTPWRLTAGDNPDWSPDGDQILFRSNVEVDNKQSQIYLVHPDGTGLKLLTHFKTGAIVASSSFSPDGKGIVFATTGVSGNADLFVMRPDGTRRHRLTRTKAWDSAPDWGPAR